MQDVKGTVSDSTQVNMTDDFKTKKPIGIISLEINYKLYYYTTLVCVNNIFIQQGCIKLI